MQPKWLFEFLLILGALISTASSLVAAESSEVSFDSGWRFHRGEMAGAERPELNDTAWRTLDVPHDWSIENLPNDAPAVSSGPFSRELSAGGVDTGWVVGGTGWYRKHFKLPRPAAGRRVEIRFDGVYMDVDIWLNGQHLGSHPYGYTAFAFHLTPFLKKNGENVLAVRVRNEGKNSRWYSGSGIFRHVWLTMTGELRVPLWGVFVTTPEVSEKKATLNVTIEVANGSQVARSAKVRVRLLSPGNMVVGTAETATTIAAGDTGTTTTSCHISAPKLWSPFHPALHRAVVEVVSDGIVADRVQSIFGIRKVEVDAVRGLRINGEPLKLKGGCVHHDNGPLGAVAIDRAEERRVEIMKAAGFNAIRTAHNPPSVAFLDACDRLGILVIDEAFDMWEKPKNPQDYHRFFKDWWERDLGTMVRRDRNHPSVIFWSIGNEVPERADPSGLAIAQRLIGTVKHLDDSRPVTEAICSFWDHPGRPWKDTDPAFALLDVGGFNYTWKEYESDHQRVPAKVMVGTESFALEAFDNWQLVEKLPYVIGDFVWTGLDYLGESGIGRTWIEGTEPGGQLGSWPWHISGCGDIDVLGIRKSQSYYREALWRPGVLHIAVHPPTAKGQVERISQWGWPNVKNHWTWPGQEGKLLRIDVYSSCQRVELKLNGRLIGEKSTTRAERYIATFEVPYEPGELLAIGKRERQMPVEVKLHTAGQPAELRVTPDRKTIHTSRNDLAYVLIEVLDAKGTVVPNVALPVHVQVSGAGELAALANADPIDTASYRSSPRITYQGVCQAIVRPHSTGPITLMARTERLKPARITITAK